MDTKGLIATLNNSGLQKTNNALYQVIQGLINNQQEIISELPEADPKPVTNPVPSTQNIPIGITNRTNGSIVTCLKNLPTAAANAAGTLSTVFSLVIPGGTFSSNVTGGDHIQWMFQGFFAANTNTKRIQVTLDGSSIFNWTGTSNGVRWKLVGQWSEKLAGTSYAIQSFLELESSTPVGSINAATMNFALDHTIALNLGTTAASDTVVETGTVLFIPQGPM